MAERRDADFMNKSLDEIAAEMDSSLYEREEREGHHRPQHRFSPYPADHGPSWRAEKESGGGSIAGSGGGDATKVFAANLNYTVTWQKLKDHMKKAGPVIKCDLFKNVDGSSRGMGLVVFADSESADRAIRELNGTEVDGRKIFLRKDMRMEDRERAGMVASHPKPRPPPNPASTVFIANLDYSITWQKLRDIFKVAGKIMHVDVQTDKEGKPRGCASVQFETPSEAMNAIILFHGQMLQNRPMVVRMDSKSPYQPDPIQLKLLVGKGGLMGGLGGGAVGGSGLAAGGVVGGSAVGGAGLAATLPPLNPALGGLAASLPLTASLPQSGALSLTSPLSGQLPILAALGLSALNNLRHFSPEQLTLLGISPALLQQAIGKTVGVGVAGGGAIGVAGGGAMGVANTGSSLLGQSVGLPTVVEQGSEGLVSQLPFAQLLSQQKVLTQTKEKEFSFRMPQEVGTSACDVPMATNLSLAAALATPTASSSTTQTGSGQSSTGEMGKKGKRVFVRNLNFNTTWQSLKDHLKVGTGPITYVDILKNADGRSRGCAAVIFETEEGAEKAIRLFDQSELDGRRINIRYDRAN